MTGITITALLIRGEIFVLPLGKYDNIDMGEDGIALVRDLEGLRAYFRPADSAFITDFCFLEDYPFHQLGVNKKLVDGRELYGAGGQKRQRRHSLCV